MTRPLLFAYLGDPSASSRALRQLRALAAIGVEATVVGFGALGDAGALPSGLDVQMLPLPPGSGPPVFWRAHRALRAYAARAPASLYLASDLYVLPALAGAAARHGGRLVFDSRELYAALDASAGRPFVSATWRAVEGRYIRRADAVLTVSEGIADRLAAAYGIERPTVIPNVPDGSPPVPSDRLQRALGVPDDGRALVLYQGLFREGRGLTSLLEAARSVDAVRVVLVGEGPLEGRVRALAAPLGDRAAVHPFVPPRELPSWTVGADVGACLIEPLTDSLRLSLPNKLFEYLNAGVPVLASPLPEIRRAVEPFGVGVLADPDDPPAVARALRLASDPDARARWREAIPDARAAFSSTEATRRFQQLLQTLLP